MKTCKDCRVSKSKTEFYTMARSVDGLHYYCKTCCALHRKRDAVTKRDKKNGLSNRQRYRAVQLGVEHDTSISISKLYKRDKGICAICRRFVEPKMASPDHIIPIARGGTHTWENLQLTHVKCNKVKGTRAHELVVGLKPRLTKKAPPRKKVSHPSSRTRRKPSMG